MLLAITNLKQSLAHKTTHQLHTLFTQTPPCYWGRGPDCDSDGATENSTAVVPARGWNDDNNNMKGEGGAAAEQYPRSSSGNGVGANCYTTSHLSGVGTFQLYSSGLNYIPRGRRGVLRSSSVHSRQAGSGRATKSRISTPGRPLFPSLPFLNKMRNTRKRKKSGKMQVLVTDSSSSSCKDSLLTKFA